MKDIHGPEQVSLYLVRDEITISTDDHPRAVRYMEKIVSSTSLAEDLIDLFMKRTMRTSVSIV